MQEAYHHSYILLDVCVYMCVYRCVCVCVMYAVCYSTCYQTVPMRTITLSYSQLSPRFCWSDLATLPICSHTTSLCLSSTCFRKSPSRFLCIHFVIFYGLMRTVHNGRRSFVMQPDLVPSRKAEEQSRTLSWLDLYSVTATGPKITPELIGVITDNWQVHSAKIQAFLFNLWEICL